MRHTLKPLGYVRYGDDFTLFVDTEAEAQRAKAEATDWLARTLSLQVHRKNNALLPAKAGLHFLGHTIHPDSSLSVDQAMVRKIERDLCYQNVASYQAMALPKRFSQQLPWLLASRMSDEEP